MAKPLLDIYDRKFIEKTINNLLEDFEYEIILKHNRYEIIGSFPKYIEGIKKTCNDIDILVNIEDRDKITQRLSINIGKYFGLCKLVDIGRYSNQAINTIFRIPIEKNKFINIQIDFIFSKLDDFSKFYYYSSLSDNNFNIKPLFRSWLLNCILALYDNDNEKYRISSYGMRNTLDKDSKYNRNLSKIFDKLFNRKVNINEWTHFYSFTSLIIALLYSFTPEDVYKIFNIFSEHLNSSKSKMIERNIAEDLLVKSNAYNYFKEKIISEYGI
jgi:hypothetical protein